MDGQTFLPGDFLSGVLTVMGLGGVNNISETVLRGKTAKNLVICHVAHHGMTSGLLDRIHGIGMADQAMNFVSCGAEDFENSTADCSSRSSKKHCFSDHRFTESLAPDLSK